MKSNLPTLQRPQHFQFSCARHFYLAYDPRKEELLQSIKQETSIITHSQNSSQEITCKTSSTIQDNIQPLLKQCRESIKYLC